jgi:glycosyltransferase XagB
MAVAGSETPIARRRRMPTRVDARQGTSGQPFQRDIGQLDRGVNDFRRRADLSAATPLRRWQQLTLLPVPALLTAGLILLDGPGLFLWLLVNLIVRPFYWEKTMHGSSMQRPTRPAHRA